MFKHTNKTIFSVYLTYFISMVLFTLTRIAAANGIFNNVHSQVSSIIYSVIIQIFIMFLIPLTIFSLINKKEGGFKRTFNSSQFKPIKPKVILIAIALGLLAFFINIAVSTVFNGFISFFGYNNPFVSGGAEIPIFSGGWELLINLVLVALLPAFCEEFLHRGLLLNEISKIGYKKAIILSALLFSLIHFNINQISYAFVIGLILAVVVVVSKNIWPAIIIHFINNGISVYITSAKANGWFGGNFYEIISNFLQSQSPILTLISSFTFLVLIVFTVIYLLMLLFKETTIAKVNNAINSVLYSGNNNSPNKPNYADEYKVLNEILLKNSSLNVEYDKAASPIDIILPVNKNIYKPSVLDNTFLIASIVLGGLATIFTFVWGIL